MKENPILPNRALYICNNECGPTCAGCILVQGDVKWTSTLMHAKNGPVKNVRDWEKRFEIKDINNELTYVEKSENE